MGQWTGREVVFWAAASKLWNRLKSLQRESIDLLHCNTDANNSMYLSSEKSGLIEHDMPLILMPAQTGKELLLEGCREHVKPALQGNEHTLWLLLYTPLILRNRKVPWFGQSEASEYLWMHVGAWGGVWLPSWDEGCSHTALEAAVPSLRFSRGFTPWRWLPALCPSPSLRQVFSWQWQKCLPGRSAHQEQGDSPGALGTEDNPALCRAVAPRVMGSLLPGWSWIHTSAPSQS